MLPKTYKDINKFQKPDLSEFTSYFFGFMNMNNYFTKVLNLLYAIRDFPHCEDSNELMMRKI